MERAAETKQARLVFRAYFFWREECLESKGRLNRACSWSFDVNHRSLNHRKPLDVHADPWAYGSRGYHRSSHNHRIERHRRNPHMSQLCLDPRAIRIQTGQLGLLPRRHHVRHCRKTVEVGIAAVNRGADPRQSSGQSAGGRLLLSRSEPGLGDKLIRLSRSERQNRLRVIASSGKNPMHHLQATIVIAGVQPRRHHSHDQPSPCLFHRLNPLCQIDEGHFDPLATDTKQFAGKFPASSASRPDTEADGRSTRVSRLRQKGI